MARLLCIVLVTAGYSTLAANAAPTILAAPAVHTAPALDSPGRNGCAWWDILQLCQAVTAPADDIIDHIEGLSNEVKDAAKDVIDDLMNKLGGVLTKVEAVAIKVGEEGKSIIKTAMNAVDDVVKNIIAKLQTLIGKTVSEVRHALLDVIGDVTELVNTIFDRMDSTLHGIEQVVYKTLCTIDGMEKHLERFVDDFLHNSMTGTKSDCDCMHQSAAWWKDSCSASCTCKKPLFSKNYACPLCYLSTWELNGQDHKLFTALKCKTMKEIEAGVAANHTAAWIVTQLSSIEELAYQEHCMHYSTHFANHFLDEAVNMTKLIATWDPPSEATVLTLRAHAFLVPPVQATEIEATEAETKEVEATAEQDSVAHDVHDLVQMLQRQQAVIQKQGEALTRLQSDYARQQLEIDVLHSTRAARAVSSSAVAHKLASDCGTPFECWTKSMAALQTAEAMVKDAENRTDAAELALERATAGLKDELKLFHGDQCPDGWVESPVTKGFVLVGRPDKGTAGTQLNHPLKNGEKARVGPHSHGVTLTDNGHGHSISDPGHSHHLGIQEYSGNTIGGGEHTGMGSSNTDASPTGISIDSAKSNIDISVDETTSEGYPLAYVLLCQHATRSLVH